MRAILIEKIVPQIGESISLTGDAFHHLKNVARIKLGEKLLVLNGNGLKIECTVEAVEKRSIIVSVKDITVVKEERHFDVVFCLTKKNSIELAIKMAVELNIRNFYISQSDYSQKMNTFKQSRVYSLVESAVIQSNAPYLTQVSIVDNLLLFLKQNASNYKKINVFDLESSAPKSREDQDGVELIVIGPEGGLSKDEREALRKIKTCDIHSLPLNIMRAPTALCTAVGYLLGCNK
jgi:16S rRNA (uracil1498-N3)-methyltransferase